MRRRIAAGLAATAMILGACAYRASHEVKSDPRSATAAAIYKHVGNGYEVVYDPRTDKFTAEAKNGKPSYGCEPGNRSAIAAFSFEVDGREVDCLDN